MSEHREQPREDEFSSPHPGEPEAGQTPAEVMARTGSRHELSDVRSRPPIIFMIAVLAALGAITLVIGGFGFTLYTLDKRINPPRSSLSLQAVVPPEPRLQSSPKADMAQMLDEEAIILNGYDWVNRQQGVVRIPIERSMLILGQRGLPPKRHDIPTTAGAAAVTTTTARTTVGPIR